MALDELGIQALPLQGALHLAGQANMAVCVKSEVIMWQSCINPLTLHYVLIILIPCIDIAGPCVLRDAFHCRGTLNCQCPSLRLNRHAKVQLCADAWVM